MAAQAKALPRDVKVRELRDRLRADGVDFEVPDREQKELVNNG
jgi:hypothetical protein